MGQDQEGVGAASQGVLIGKIEELPLAANGRGGRKGSRSI